jgi:single-strand DNA-binding protein
LGVYNFTFNRAWNFKEGQEVNSITVVGNVGKEPELRYSQNGTAVCNVSVATTQGKDDNAKTTWHYVTTFGSMAENVAATIKKGQRVIAVGRLDKSSYEKDGVTVERTNVIAEHFGADLRFSSSEQ